MWVLVFIYFYDNIPYVEEVTRHSSMVDCFSSREALSAEIGNGLGYFKPGQQAICLKI